MEATQNLPLVSGDGVVQSVVFTNEENGYTVLRLLTDDGDLVTCVGCIPCAAPGERLTFTATEEVHPQHGEQYHVVDVERELPETEQEICDYLSSGICRGVGPATARLIVDYFGADTLRVMEETPEKLSRLRGVTDKKAAEIGRAFREHMGLRRLMSFLARYRLPPNLAMLLRRNLGDGALESIRSNPYLLTSDSYSVPFSVTDTIALELGFAEDSAFRIEAAVLFELVHNEGNGHVFLPRGKLIDASARLLDCAPDACESALDRLLERREIVEETVANVRACYLERLYQAEKGAVLRLKSLIEAAADVSRRAGGAIAAIEREQGITYAPRQRHAVEAAARKGVLLLTGGPGTGKTTTLRGIVALFRSMGLDISLAAPTGRAAARMAELSGLEAMTIHRLLGAAWDEGSQSVAFSKNEKDPLTADAVIVDEMSMVDLELFAALLRALRPGTRLVLVGDADQLPSVGAGTVFSDLIRSGRVETIVLTDVFRQAEQSAIIRNAHAVNQGIAPRLVNDQGDFFFMSRRRAEQAAETIVSLCAERLPKNMKIPASEIQVLTPTRKGPCGTEQLNTLLQSALNPPAKGKSELAWGERRFRCGDRVMQTRNDYDILWERENGEAGSGIFNGDIGRITAIDPSGEFLALDFDGRRATYAREMLSELELAYAQTVHKAQGSEYRCVVFAAVPCAQGLCVRPVLYTAITRAKQLLISVGDDAVLRTMTDNAARTRRYCGLCWRLRHAFEDEE